LAPDGDTIPVADTALSELGTNRFRVALPGFCLIDCDELLVSLTPHNGDPAMVKLSTQRSREQVRAEALAKLKQGQALLAVSKQKLDSAQKQLEIAQALIDDSAKALRETATYRNQHDPFIS
jgi:hypothetical protein